MGPAGAPSPMNPGGLPQPQDPYEFGFLAVIEAGRKLSRELRMGGKEQNANQVDRYVVALDRLRLKCKTEFSQEASTMQAANIAAQM